jgi:hypothetical protein
MREVFVEIPYQRLSVLVPADADQETIDDAIDEVVHQSVQYWEVDEDWDPVDDE